MKLPVHWRTTLQSWLTVLIGIPPALAEFTTVIPRKLGLAIAIAAALAKVILGQMQKDAGIVEAYVPGKREPEAVSAHPIPDNPAAVPVIAKEQ